MKNKLKKIKLGRFYGEYLFLEVPENINFDFEKKFQEYIESIKINAIEEYKSNQLLASMKAKIKDNEKNESFAFKLYKNIIQ